MQRLPSVRQHISWRDGPLTSELTRLFEAIPSAPLEARLQKTEGRGPKGYSARSLFRVFVASYYLNHDSIAATVRALQENPALSAVCNLRRDRIPSRPTLSRFFRRLTERRDELQAALAALTNGLHDALPGFGHHVAVDSSTIRTHSSPDRTVVADCEATWTAKGYKVGSTKRQWHWGYKLHLAVDTETELPITGYVTTAKSADSINLIPVLGQARDRFEWFAPKYVSADRGYDSQANCRAVIEDFEAAPIIAMRAMRPGARNRRPNTSHRVRGVIPRWSAAWSSLYKKRTAVERCFGRLKQSRRLERHCYRGLAKIETHCLLSVLTMQAKALVQIEAAGNLRECLRKVA